MLLGKSTTLLSGIQYDLYDFVLQLYMNSKLSMFQ